jgi:hypothetical protein
LEEYPRLIALGDGEFTTEGYAPSFISDWLSERIKEKKIVKSFWGGLKFGETYETELLEKLHEKE